MKQTVSQFPLGVFDSGLGGLTALRALTKCLPHEDIFYLGDTGRVPYGVRSEKTILQYTEQDLAFLMKKGVKAILCACGTVSAVSLPILQKDFPLPIYGVLAPAVNAALSATHSGKIGIIGTQATIQSGAYEALLRENRSNLSLTSIPCPLFVPLVENGRIHPGDVVIETIVAEYLAAFKDAKIDTLILGCTHYPLLEKVIGNFLGKEVTLISSGAQAAIAMAEDLKEKGLLNPSTVPGKKEYFVTDSAKNFSTLASLFLEENVAAEVSQVTLF